MSKQNKEYLKSLVSYVESLEQGRLYSIQRIDIVVIAISTSAIVLVSNVIQNLKPENLCYASGFKTGILFFATAVILNLASQPIAYYNFSLLRGIYDEKIIALKYNEKSNEKKYDRENNLSKKLARITALLNYSSVAAVIFGIIISIIFFLFL